MKIVRSAVLFILVGLIFVGLAACAEEETAQTPSAAYEQFRRHVLNKNIEEVARGIYVAPEVRDRQTEEEFVERVGKWIDELGETSRNTEGELAQFELLSETIVGDTAQLEYRVPHYGDGLWTNASSMWTITMKFDDGIWKWMPGYTRSTLQPNGMMEE